MDSACTHHMCNDRALFSNSDFSRKLDFPPVLGANLANPLAVEGVGSVVLPALGGTMLLKNVLFVPSIGKNLICVSRLLNDGYSLTFNSSMSGLPGCVLRLKDRVICLPIQKNNLWVVPPVEENVSPSAHMAATMADWHLRLGHIPPTVISKMAANSSIKGLQILPGGRSVKDSCVDCFLGKQARAPLISTPNKRATVRLERVHADLSGPWKVPTCGRQCLYLLSFIDDHSRYVWIYLLKKKSEVFDTFQKWKILVENQSERRLKHFRSDNGGEFCSNAYEDFFAKCGIIHEHTTPYTPQENGTAERFNRTIQEKTQCLLQTAHFPDSLWGEAAMTACTLYNMTIHSALPADMTPFEAWHDFKPTANNLHIFGCDVTVHIPDHKRKKPDSHAKQGKFVGYAQKQPGWRVWYPSDKTVVEVRDVKFFDAPILNRCMDVLYPPSSSLPFVSNVGPAVPTPIPPPPVSPVPVTPMLDDTDVYPDSAPTSALPGTSEGGNFVLSTGDVQNVTTNDTETVPVADSPSFLQNPVLSNVSSFPVPKTQNNPAQNQSTSSTTISNPTETSLPPNASQTQPQYRSLSPIPEISDDDKISAATESQVLETEWAVPDLRDLLTDQDLEFEVDEPEDILAASQLHMIPYSDRPLPRRSGRAVRRPVRLHYSKAGSPDPDPEANMTVSGIHTIPTNTLLNSVYPTHPAPLTDHSLLHSCFLAELDSNSIDDDIDTCFPLTSENLSHDEKPLCFLSESSTLTSDPTSLAEALAGPDGDLWKAAYDDEMASIDHHDTYTWEKLPEGRSLITGKLVFKKKPARDGKPVRYKVRGCARGFSQKEGLDYNEIFAPVVKYKTLRLACGIAARYDMHMHKMDVKTAFLHGNLEEDIYMKPLPGCTPPLGKEGCVWKLHKALYGLKQSPRCWNTLLHDYLVSEGFTRLISDYGTYRRGKGKGMTLITVYVDDLLILNRNIHVVNSIKTNLSKRFDMVDFGEAQSILGISITRDREKGTLSLHQGEYIDNVLATFQQADGPTRVTPLESGVRLHKALPGEGNEEHPYRALVGSLMHVMVCTRPDIAAAVGVLSRFLDNSTDEHWEAALRVLHYLKGTRSENLTFRRDSTEDIYGYCDSDWAGDVDDNRSTTGWIFIWCGAAVSWQSKKQKSTAQSSCEAEYYAAGMAALEVSWYWNILTELHMTPAHPIVVYSDSQSAMNLSANPVFHERSKHIANKWHHIREMIYEGLISIAKVHTDENLADALTKAVPGPKVTFCRLGMGLSPVAMFSYWMLGITIEDGSINVPPAA